LIENQNLSKLWLLSLEKKFTFLLLLRDISNIRSVGMINLCWIFWFHARDERQCDSLKRLSISTVDNLYMEGTALWKMHLNLFRVEIRTQAMNHDPQISSRNWQSSEISLTWISKKLCYPDCKSIQFDLNFTAPIIKKHARSDFTTHVSGFHSFWRR
jgi:hypothetical protein